MAEVKFVVLGTPQTAGSKTGYPYKKKGGGRGVVVVDANPKAKSWMQEVRMAASEAHKGRPLMLGPIILTYTAHLVRPKCHYRTGKNSKLLKPDAPAYPASKPDLLKLVRNVEDALTKIVYYDDAQIVVEHLYKVYAGIANCEVVVTEMDGMDTVNLVTTVASSGQPTQQG